MPEPISQEQFAEYDDIRICFQTFGDPQAPPLLLVMGLGGPMIWWDEALCLAMASTGFHVIRYDNRDTGRSSRDNGRVHTKDLVAAFTGLSRRAPYSLSGLARDGIAVLDTLGLDRAHVMGMSMGGMIAQTMAIEYPDRVASLVSVMSSTGRRRVGYQDPRLLPRLLRSSPDRATYLRNSVAMWALIGSPAFPTPASRVEARSAATWDRGHCASGVARQMLAVLTQPDRTSLLQTLAVPAAVVHGTRDRMVHVSGGRATAAALPDAELVLIDGMGHDLPEQLWDRVCSVVRRTADRAAPPR